MKIGILAFDEPVELRLMPPAGTEAAFRQPAELERPALFPMTAAQPAGPVGGHGPLPNAAKSVTFCTRCKIRHPSEEANSSAAPQVVRGLPAAVLFKTRRTRAATLRGDRRHRQ